MDKIDAGLLGIAVAILIALLGAGLKYLEFKFSIAKEKFLRRLALYEFLNLHAMRLSIASLVEPGNEEAEKSAHENWLLLQEDWLRSMA